MKGLYRLLPPFAADISGVCSALFELGGLVVIHEPACCTSAFATFDEPRWYGSSSALYSSELRDVQVASGDDETLLRRIESAARTKGGKFIAIVGSPVPMAMGTDYQALARLAERRTGLPAFACDVTGTGCYDVGASIAFLELARNFVKPASPDREPLVNVLGATPLDLGGDRPILKLTRMLGASGCRVLSCWTMGSSLECIAQSARARLNLVLSHTGLRAARYLESEFGTPYLVGLPIGPTPARSFMTAVRSRLRLATRWEYTARTVAAEAGAENALVIGEQVMANAIRDCLRSDLGVGRVTVASFFDMEADLLKEGDVRLKDEDSLRALVGERQYDLVVGDPLFRDLVVASPKTRFASLPHLAVSGQLHWDADVDYLDEAGLAMLRGEVCRSRKTRNKFLRREN